MKFELIPKKAEMPSPDYRLVLSWEHGDADAEIKSELFVSAKKLQETLFEIFDYLNFIPNTGYQGLGHYDCVCENLSGYEWVEYDIIYGNYDYPAKLEKVQVFLGNQEYDVADLAARATNQNLPPLPLKGEKLTLTHDELPGLTHPNYICGRSKIYKLAGKKPFEGWVDDIQKINTYPHYDEYEVVLFVPEYKCHVAVRRNSV